MKKRKQYYPKKITIKGQSYNVFCHPTQESYVKVRDAEKDECGLCDKMGKEIHINLEVHRDIMARVRETLLHEIGHAIFEEAGICYGIPEQIEEIIVGCLF